MKNSEAISFNDERSDDAWLGNDVPEYDGGKNDKKEYEKIVDFLRDKYFSKEYDEMMSPFIRKLDPNRVWSFNERILSNNKKRIFGGYRQIVLDMADILGLEKPPDCEFLSLSDSQRKELGLEEVSAYYDEDIDSICILNVNDDNHYNRVSSVVRIVAHEMWHKYQHEEIKRCGSRADIYRNNFNNYIRDNDDLYGYTTQPVEAEALIFGAKFANAFRRILINSLQEDIDDYNEKVSQGIFDNPPDEDHKWAYDDIAKQKEKEIDQLSHLKNMIDWDNEMASCSQTR